MKLFLGSKLVVGATAAAGLAIAATGHAGAQEVLRSFRDGSPAVIVSDVERPYAYGRGAYADGPYAAMPPELPRYAAAPSYAPAVLSPRDIEAIARDSGFSPLGAPQQRGFVYTMSVINLDGDDGRLVMDARTGRLLRFMPAYRMGGRMNEEIVATYGPVGPPPADDRAAPRPPVPLPHVASRTPNVPLPKAAPVHPVVAPPKPVAAAPAVAPVPAQQSAAVTHGETTGTAAATPAAPKAATPAVEAKSPEAKVEAKAAPEPLAETKPAVPGIQPTQAMPPVQGLE